MATDPVHELITSIRARVEAELDAYAPALTARYEATVADARKEADAEADRRWSSLLETQKTHARQELQTAIAAARAESPQGRMLLDAFREIDSASSVSAVLTLISDVAAAQSKRARLYVGPQFEPWNGEETPPAALTGTLQQAVGARSVVRHEANGLAVPLVLDGASVAVLYAEADEVTQSWADSVELLGRYGAAHLACVTALRTAHVQRWIAAPSANGLAMAYTPTVGSTEGGADGDSLQAAKRYARLLVSEIKLYNEAAVREGREKRDLARRLGPEIERARRLYEERVPSSVIDRARHFHHELVQTLAGGDSALLG